MEMLTKKGRRVETTMWIASVVLGLAACSLILGHKGKMDEAAHYDQILMYLQHKWELVRRPGEPYPTLAVLPGYHVVMAQIARVTRLGTPDAFRLYNYGISLLLAGMLFAVTRSISSVHARIRSAQIYLLPILFPFHVLIYTDTLSLTLVVAALAACMRGRRIMAMMVATLAIGVRQTNVVWACYIGLFSFIEMYGWTWQKRNILTYIRTHGVFAVPVIAFVLFLIFNGRISLCDPEDHPLRFSFVNVTLSIFVFWLLYLPFHIANCKRIVEFSRGHPRVTLLILAGALLLAGTFQVAHRWNVLDFLLRNHLIHGLTQSAWTRGVLAFGMAWTILSLAVTPLNRSAAYLVYPFWLLCLVPEALMEFRYYIPAFVLLHLFWERKNFWLEVILWLYFVLLAFGIHLLHVQTRLVL